MKLTYTYDCIATFKRSLTHVIDPKANHEIENVEQIIREMDKESRAVGPFSDSYGYLPDDHNLRYCEFVSTERNYGFHPDKTDESDEWELYDTDSTWTYSHYGQVSADSAAEAKEYIEEEIGSFIPAKNWEFLGLFYKEFKQAKISDEGFHDKFKVVQEHEGAWRMMEYYDTHQLAEIAVKYFVYCKKYDPSKIAIQYLPTLENSNGN